MELGGKCPVIVDESADIDNAALRITFGRFTNCGQVCVAGDYVYVHEKVEEKFKQKLLQTIKEGYKIEEIRTNGDYSKIVNEHHVERLREYINQNHQGKVLL